MNKDELSKNIARMEKELEAMKVELDKPDELVPYDWREKEDSWSCIKRFHFDNEPQTQRFAHKLHILSCINNLKKTLGCDWEFTDDARNYYLLFNTTKNCWVVSDSFSWSKGAIYFKKREDVIAVADFLNEHFPKGWSSPSEGA